MQLKFTKYQLLLIPVTAFLILLRVFKLQQTGLYDYDSVWTWLVSKEIANGNFVHLFSHRSPSMYLFYSLFSGIFSDYHSYIYLNMAFGIVAVLIFSYWATQKLQLDDFYLPFLTLFAGSCFYLVHAARLFSYDNISLFLVVWCIIFFFQFIENKSTADFYKAIISFTVSFTFNYKTILLLPVLGIIMLYSNGFRVTKTLFFTLLKGVFIFTGISFIYCITGVFLGLKIYAYPASFFGFLLSPQPNAAGHVGFFSTDFDFYFRYLLQYESPLILVGFLLAPFILFLKFKKDKIITTNLVLLFVFCYLFFLQMCFAIKAPRGILFIYPFIYVLVFWVLVQLVKNKWVVLVIILAHTVFMDYQAKWHIYDFSKTNYPEVVNFLRKNNIQKIGTTLGINIIPFADGITVKTVFTPADMDSLKKENIEYLLVDDYYKIAGADALSFTEKYETVFSVTEPTMLYPMQHLEHAEYSDNTFTEVQQSIAKAKQSGYGLRVVKIKE